MQRYSTWKSRFSAHAELKKIRQKGLATPDGIDEMMYVLYRLLVALNYASSINKLPQLQRHLPLSLFAAADAHGGEAAKSHKE